MQKICLQTQIYLITINSNLSFLDKWPQVYLYFVLCFKSQG